MASNSHDQPSQAFRGLSKPGTTYIPTVTDTNTGDCVVLWEDIQDAFAGAKTIRNGDLHVPFLRDANFARIMPLRIAYHPGAVLNVLENSSSQPDMSSKASHPAVGTVASEEPSNRSNDPNLRRMSTCSGNTPFIGQDRDNGSITIVEIPKELHSSLRSYGNLYIDAIMTGQEMQTSCIKQSMDVQFDRLQVELDRNKVLQEELVKMQQQMQQLQYQSSVEILERQKLMNEKQDRIIHMQQQALNQLAVVQSRAKALLTQTYELHEYPIPRLFIVLPNDTGLRNRTTIHFSGQFRLHFLCECGAHTMPEDCRTPHEVHLAKHEGYDLEQPTKFFEQYGTYVLAMMYIIKYGITTAGLTVPPLANFKVVDEVGQRHAEYLRNNIGPLVDNTINYLRGLKSNAPVGHEVGTDLIGLDKLHALDGADLRQLESYLKIKDQGRSLGNLYRIVTQEGHVKWVCIDHYRGNYQEAAMQQLRNVVEVNRGKFIEEIGKIEIKFATKELAKQFYDTLINARGIQELDITLEWNATRKDFRLLAKAVAAANVIRLGLEGTQLKGSALDVLNRNRRFDPILQVVSNTRIQSLHLKGFDDIFSQVKNSSISLPSKIRELSMDYVPYKNKGIKSFNGFLEQCVSLTTVELKIQNGHPITKTVGDVLGKLRKLESLRIDHGNLLLTAMISEGKIQDMSLTMKRLADLSDEDFTFVLKCNLTRLDIEYTPQDAEESRLESIIRQCPRLNTLRVGCVEERCLAVIKLVVSKRTALIQGAGPSRLRTFELMNEKLVPFDKYADFNDSIAIHAIISFTEDSSIIDMCTRIRLQLDMPTSKEDIICDIVREYGWSIMHLKTLGPLSERFLRILDDITSEKGSRLEKLEFAPFSVTDSGLDWIHSIIDRSPSWIGLVLWMQGLDMDGRVEETQQLLSQHRERIHGLILHGGSPEVWLPEIVSAFPTRQSFPNLRTIFGASFTERTFTPSNCVPWFITMTQAPQQLELESSGKPTSQEAIAVQSPSSLQSPGMPSVGQTNLTTFCLRRVDLHPMEWKMMIEAIDLSSLQRLVLHDANVGLEQFKLLLDRILNKTENVPLKYLDLHLSDVAKTTDSWILDKMLAPLRVKAPGIEIVK
ncbi:hypothetical protein BGX31_000570 [Mortierella sp. GBA43]|nr:hypothetical protein BGX31_000570 [Mortierella sp. GBA43]